MKAMILAGNIKKRESTSRIPSQSSNTNEIHTDRNTLSEDEHNQEEVK